MLSRPKRVTLKDLKRVIKPRNISRGVKSNKHVQHSRQEIRRGAFFSELGPILTYAASTTLAMKKVEAKEVVPMFKGTDHPVELRSSFLGYKFDPTDESKLLRNAFKSMFTGKHYTFELGTALNMSSSASGAINSVITCANLASLSDFSSLASVFSEYFIQRIEVKWQPVSRYNGPIGYLPATTVSSLPFSVTSLQNSQPAYTSMSSSLNNDKLSYENSNVPFSYTWVNNNKMSADIVTDPSAFAFAPTQSWASVLAASLYTGSIQLLSQSAPPALPVSAVLGTFATKYLVSFRNRD